MDGTNAGDLSTGLFVVGGEAVRNVALDAELKGGTAVSGITSGDAILITEGGPLGGNWALVARPVESRGVAAFLAAGVLKVKRGPATRGPVTRSMVAFLPTSSIFILFMTGTSAAVGELADCGEARTFAIRCGDGKAGADKAAAEDGKSAFPARCTGFGAADITAAAEGAKVLPSGLAGGPSRILSAGFADSRAEADGEGTVFFVAESTEVDKIVLDNSHVFAAPTGTVAALLSNG